MNQITSNRKPFKRRIPVIILSLIALIFIAVSSTRYFMYLYVYNDYGNRVNYALELYLPDFYSLLYLITSLTPCILFTLYILKFYKNSKTNILIPIIYGFPVASALVEVIEFCIHQYFPGIIHCVLFTAQIATFTLAIIITLNRCVNKTFPMIALIVGTVYNIYRAFIFINNLQAFIEYGQLTTLITIPLDIIGSISLYVALMIFIWNNKAVIIPKKSPDNEETTDFELSLTLLNDRFINGEISEEEYHIQRAEIINML